MYQLQQTCKFHFDLMRASASAAVVVPGGMGPMFGRALGDDEEVCDVLVGAVHGGEAAVDFVLLAEGPALERLRSGAGCPVIAVMALISCCAADLEVLRDAVESSDRWDTALRLWMRWNCKVEPRAFRATALREEVASAPKVNAVASAAGAGVWRRWHWAVSMKEWDLEVVVIWLGAYALCGLPLTPGWVANGKEFWPAEYDAGEASELQLRPSVCYGLLLASRVRPTDLLLDPMAGSAAIPRCAIAQFGSGFAIAGDTRRVSARGRCAQRAGALQRMRSDVRALPLRDGCIDVLVADFPWNKRHKADHALLPEALVEFGRVLDAAGTAVLLLPRSESRRLSRLDSPFVVDAAHPVVVGGFPVSCVALRKAAASAPAERGAGRGGQSEALGRDVATSACCCAATVCEALARRTLAELLVDMWPTLVPTQSAAKRAVRHGRVSLASDPAAPLRHSRSHVEAGERVILRPLGTTKLLGVDEAMALGPLTVLWEDDSWLVVIKPSGMEVLSGRRSLANAVRGLQAQRERGGGGDDDGAGEEESAPWTVAYDGDSNVGGAWLVAKSAQPALALLDGRAAAWLRWRCVVRGRPSAESMGGLGEGDDDGDGGGRSGELNLRVLRSAPSMRFGWISEATFTLAAPSVHIHESDWLSAAAAAGHEVIGGGGRRNRGPNDGPRTHCAWVESVSVSAPTATSERETVADSLPTAPPPERFERLFEKEALVCRLRLGAGGPLGDAGETDAR